MAALTETDKPYRLHIKNGEVRPCRTLPFVKKLLLGLLSSHLTRAHLYASDTTEDIVRGMDEVGAITEDSLPYRLDVLVDRHTNSWLRADIWKEN